MRSYKSSFFPAFSLVKQYRYILPIIFLITLSTRGFEYKNWPGTYMGWTQNIINFFLLLSFLIGLRKIKGCNFRKEIILLTFLPFLSIFNSLIYHNQSVYNSIVALSVSFTWILYFLLHKYRVSEAMVLKVFLLLSLLIFGIQIVQQITYPNASFGVASQDSSVWGAETAEKRNGLWRFRMHFNGFLTVPILFAFWCWFIKTGVKRIIPMLILLLASIYLTLTRQVMAATLIGLVLPLFAGNRKGKVKILIILLVVFAILYNYYDILFSSLVETTQEQSGSDYIRFIAADFYWNESIKNPMLFLCGHGVPANKGEYFSYINHLWNNYGFYTADIGFIGQIYERGVLYVVTCFYLMIRIFFSLRKRVPLYIRTFVLFAGVMSPMIFAFISPIYFIVWAMVLYVCDLHLNHSPLALRVTQNNDNKFS